MTRMNRNLLLCAALVMMSSALASAQVKITPEDEKIAENKKLAAGGAE